MTMNEIKTAMPKGTSRVGDFVQYNSKTEFVAEAHMVPESARDAIKNELTNIFTLYAHNSGQFVCATLYFSKAGIAKEDRKRHLVIDCRGAEVECEFADSIKNAKIRVREILAESAPAVEAETDTAEVAEKPAKAATKSTTKAKKNNKSTNKAAAAKTEAIAEDAKEKATEIADEEETF